MASQARREDSLGNFDVQLIGNFLSFASRGDRVGLNQMLREGIFPDVQDYDKRTALHLAASEGHASIVELLLQYKAQVNLKDRWLRTPLTDARLYGHRDICRILEVNGGKDSTNDQPMTMLEGSHLIDENLDSIHLKPVDFEPKFRFSKCPARIQELIENCCSKDLSKRPSFANVIDNLEESSTHFGKAGCPVC